MTAAHAQDASITSGVRTSRSRGTSKVLILGAEGSGKTVLLTVLANRYERPLNGFRIEARSREAYVFARTNWEYLANRRDWPPATLPGNLASLHWALHAPDGSVYDITSLDYAGEIFRRAFGKEDRTAPEAQALVREVDTSDIVIVLVNLRDLLDTADAERRLEDEWAPKAVLDYVMSKNKRVALVFTQADRYRGVETDHGGWRRVCEARLPQIYHAYPNINIIAVAAVNDTETVESTDMPGTFRSRPAPDFSSQGLEELLRWISGVAESFASQRRSLRACAFLGSLFTVCCMAWLAWPLSPKNYILRDIKVAFQHKNPEVYLKVNGVQYGDKQSASPLHRRIGLSLQPGSSVTIEVWDYHILSADHILAAFPFSTDFRVWMARLGRRTVKTSYSWKGQAHGSPSTVRVTITYGVEF